MDQFLQKHRKMRNFLIVSLVIVAATWLSQGGVVNSVCCNTKATLNYSIVAVGCGAVGGRPDNNKCTITICANGEVMMGSHCGNGTCNSDGCGCVDGCLQGRWAKDFLKNNREYIISVSETIWDFQPQKSPEESKVKCNMF